MKLFSTKFTDPQVSIGILFLRVTVGLAMAFNHGYTKLIGFNTMLEKGFSDPFHIGAKASLSLTIFAEFFCALLIVFGLLTRLATIPLIIAMSVAFFVAHNGELFGKGESAAIYLSIFICLLFTGPGKYSIDKAIGK